MHASKELTSTSFEDLLKLSKSFLELDISSLDKLSSSAHLIQYIEEKKALFPYIHTLDLSDNGFEEQFAPLNYYTDFFTKQTNLVLFLAKIPTSIQKIKFKDMTIRLDAFWAVHIFNQLQAYAVELSHESNNWLRAFNQEVWTNQGALNLIARESLPKTMTLDTIRILENLCLTTNTSFSWLCASWINKGLISKQYYQPNKQVAKTYFQQALILFSPKFDESIIHESQLNSKPFVELGLCTFLATEDDICYLKKIITQLKPFDIFVINIQNDKLLDSITALLKTIKIDLYLVLQGSKSIYPKLLPKLSSNLIIYIPEYISQEVAIEICNHLSPDTSIELSAKLDTSIARYMLEHANVALIAPCALYNLEELTSGIAKPNLIAIPIKSSPHENRLSNNSFEVLQHNLQDITVPKKIKLPLELDTQELGEILDILPMETAIFIDYQCPLESSILIIKQQFGIVLDKNLHPKQIEYMFSYQLPTKISFSEGFPVELAKFTCQQLAKDSRVILEKHYSKSLVSTIIEEIPAHTAIEIQPNLNPYCFEILAHHRASIIIGKNFSPDDIKHLVANMSKEITLLISNQLDIDSAKTVMSYLPLSTEVIPEEDSSEELLEALAQGRQIKFDNTAIAIHSIYKPSNFVPNAATGISPDLKTSGNH